MQCPKGQPKTVRRGLQDLLGYGDVPEEEVVFGGGSDRGSAYSEGEDEDDDSVS
jgi:hypothetical protein